MRCIRFALFIFVLIPVQIYGVKKVAEIEGDVKVALLINNCQNVSDFVPFRVQSEISSTLWTVQRINYLELLSPIKLGVEIFEKCNDTDYFATIFELYQYQHNLLLGVISDEKLSENVLKFCAILNIRPTTIGRYESFLVKASLQFLNSLGWIENVTVFAPEEHVLNEFFSYSKKDSICIKDCWVYGSTCPVTINSSNPFVFFGSKTQIEHLIHNHNFTAQDLNGIFVPLDGSVPRGLPDGSFVIIPPHNPPSRIYKSPDTFHPTPAFFETAKPILSYVDNIQTFTTMKCNDTDSSKLECLKTSHFKPYNSVLMSVGSMLNILRIETLKPTFVYNIYRVDLNMSTTSQIFEKNNLFQPFGKVFEYNIFWDNITLIDQDFEPVMSNFSRTNTSGHCLSVYSYEDYNFFRNNKFTILTFRSEAWVYAFLSLSLLGVLFCISILIFILFCICRRDILEGNPILTLLLLLAVMLLFCCVLPFSLEYNKHTMHTLCLLKSLSLTLGYALVFALLLSRCILLATASKEIGFMSHIAGPVQSFLCLFIFGVQAALSLQVFGKCPEIFRGHSFVYLMSYNTMLLLLLLCLCPLIFKCQRNYREGKYFCIAIILTNCTWFVWLPLYATLDNEWKEIMLCIGLISTAGIFLGAIFIPRTYLMTIAAAREKITSTFPSLATATSAMDIYRANSQSLYDCVNVAAINAVTVARAGVTSASTQQPDLYSCPALPEDEDFDFRCDTPTSTDKVTRF